jgi:putative hemolysin
MESGDNLLLQLLILLVLIGINAFFAASEIAVISLNTQKIRRQAEEGDKKAGLLHQLLTEPSKFLATIQVGVTLSGLMASAIASESFADKLTLWIEARGVGLNASVIKLVSVVLITIILSYLTLVLGELVPKRLAMQEPEKVSNFAVKPITTLLRITAPFVKLLSISTNLVIKLFGGNPAFQEEKITEEEIRLMVEVGREKGVIQSAEQEMIDNIFEFDNTAVSEIMTHRTAVVALPLDATSQEILDTVIREKFSRIPVYQDSIDHIIGILHIQDLIPLLRPDNHAGFQLKKHIREPYFVPESKKTDELLKEMQRNKTHMAVIIDEYGGTAGIVTIEDLLEEIVGNIFDEHDEEIKEIEKMNENTFLVDGTVSLERVEEVLEIQLSHDEYDTLGGFVMGQLGRVPGETEKPEITYRQILFKVEAIKDKRISKVKIVKNLS